MWKLQRFLEDERDFDWWMSVITPPADLVAQVRRRLVEMIPNDGTGLGVRLEDGKLIMKRRNVIIASVKK